MNVGSSKAMKDILPNHKVLWLILLQEITGIQDSDPENRVTSFLDKPLRASLYHMVQCQVHSE